MTNRIYFRANASMLALATTAFFGLLLPSEAVFAQTGLANVCDGPNCNACHLVDLGNNLIQWLIGVVTVLFAVLLVIAGFQLVTAGGNPSALQSAKSKFVNAFVGFLIVLAAWLLVDTLMRALVGQSGEIEGGLFWADVRCYEQAAMSGLPPVDSSEAGTDVMIGPGVGGPGGPVELAPADSRCFPGPNGFYDGEEFEGGDDICLSSFTVSGDAYNLPDGSGLGYSAPTQYFGPDAIAANPQLTPNLRLCDITNCGADRRTGDYVVIDPFMAAQLDNIYNDLEGLQVNSGYRSPSYNRSVGGAVHSRHQYGDAVDIAVTPSNTEAEIMASCERRGATNIYTYDSGRHVHCDWRGADRN